VEGRLRRVAPHVASFLLQAPYPPANGSIPSRSLPVLSVPFKGGEGVGGGARALSRSDDCNASATLRRSADNIELPTCARTCRDRVALP